MGGGLLGSTNHRRLSSSSSSYSSSSFSVVREKKTTKKNFFFLSLLTSLPVSPDLVLSAPLFCCWFSLIFWLADVLSTFVTSSFPPPWDWLFFCFFLPSFYRVFVPRFFPILRFLRCHNVKKKEKKRQKKKNFLRCGCPFIALSIVLEKEIWKKTR